MKTLRSRTRTLLNASGRRKSNWSAAVERNFGNWPPAGARRWRIGWAKVSVTSALLEEALDCAGLLRNASTILSIQVNGDLASLQRTISVTGRIWRSNLGTTTVVQPAELHGTFVELNNLGSLCLLYKRLHDKDYVSDNRHDNRNGRCFLTMVSEVVG